MARQPRVYIEGVLYYVTSKSGQSYNLFVDDADYKEYIALIDKYKRQYGFKLFSFALLPTHLHMLIELKNKIGISNIMHDITSLYTKIYNSRYAAKGHLFQQRFNAVLAEKKTYLLPLVRHIHLNPKRDHIMADPKNYPYSSHMQYLDPAKRPYPEMQGEVEEAFGLLKGREGEFDNYVTGAPQADLEAMKKDLRRKRMLGSNEFIERMKKMLEEEKTKREDQRKRQTRQPIIIAGLGATMALALIVTIVYFQTQTRQLATEYNKTLALYQNTLASLEAGRDRALTESKGTGDYAWKIRLTEEAITNLKKGEEERIRTAKDLEGYAWKIKLTRMDAAKSDSGTEDIISFKNHQIGSNNLVQEGFGLSNYSKAESKPGLVSWETIQSNSRGDTANWRGDWNGKSMRGVLRRRLDDGTVTDYSFISIGER